MRGVLEPRLREQLALVVDWLKFAEAKHAFLLAFNGAALAALGAAAKDFRAATVAPPWWLAASVAWCALMAVLAVAVSLTAVIPELQVPWQFGRTAAGADTNLVYYGHIADWDAGAYADALAHAVGAPEGWRATRWELDLAGQVVANAQIALRKYRAFSLAAALTLGGLLTPFAALMWLAVALARRGRRRSAVGR